MEGVIRESFRKGMDYNDFISLFFDENRRCFFKVEEKDELDIAEINHFVEKNGITRRTPDGGLLLQMNDARVYFLCGKWVVCYREKPISIKTKYKRPNNSKIVVYKSITSTLEKDLPYHTSYDKDLPCWRY